MAQQLKSQPEPAAGSSTPAALDRVCDEALARIRASINRSAGQHLRAMRAAWAAGKDATATPPKGGAA